jgi:hypothetical protein
MLCLEQHDFHINPQLITTFYHALIIIYHVSRFEKKIVKNVVYIDLLLKKKKLTSSQAVLFFFFNK